MEQHKPATAFGERYSLASPTGATLNLYVRRAEGPARAVVQVADAKNLRRTLLLTSQLVEFGIPTVLVMNMMDEAEERVGDARVTA